MTWATASEGALYPRRYRPLVTCHVFTGLPGYQDPAMMFGCRAAYPQPSIGGDDDVADRTNPGPHSNGGPTAHRKRRKSFDVLRFCDCGRHGGLHGIAPGCPGMAGERLQFVQGDTPARSAPAIEVPKSSANATRSGPSISITALSINAAAANERSVHYETPRCWTAVKTTPRRT